MICRATAAQQPHVDRAVVGGEAGRLRTVFPAQRGLSVRAHFVVYPQRHAQRPEVARFVEWLKLKAS